MSLPPKRPNDPSDNKSKAKAKLPSLQIPNAPSPAVEEVAVNLHGPTYLHHTINIGGEATAPEDSEEEREQQELKVLKETDGYKLRTRFFECTSNATDPKRYKKAPTEKDLKDHYAEASPADLLGVTKMCTSWIDAAANLSIKKKRNAKVATALQKKWKNLLNTDDDARYKHFEKLRKDHKVTELRKMLADAFEDIDKALEMAAAPDDGLPQVKSGAQTPSSAEVWY